MPLLDLMRRAPGAEPALAALEDESGLYVVGGAVRDALLGRVPRELDFVAEGLAGPVARRAARRLGGEVVAHASESFLRGSLATGLAVLTWSVMLKGGRLCVTAYCDVPAVQPVPPQALRGLTRLAVGLVGVGVVIGVVVRRVDVPPLAGFGGTAMALLVGGGLLGLAYAAVGVVLTSALALVAVQVAVSLTGPVAARVVDPEHLRTA